MAQKATRLCYFIFNLVIEILLSDRFLTPGLPNDSFGFFNLVIEILLSDRKDSGGAGSDSLQIFNLVIEILLSDRTFYHSER